RFSNVVTDETGFYRFSGVVPGSYFVSISTNDYVSTEAGDFERGRPVKVRSGEDVININFGTWKSAKIRGQITDAGGHPLADQPVLLTLVAGNKNQTTSTARSYVQIRSDSKGNYRLDRVSPGRYVVSFGGSQFNWAKMVRDSGPKGSL